MRPVALLMGLRLRLNIRRFSRTRTAMVLGIFVMLSLLAFACGTAFLTWQLHLLSPFYKLNVLGGAMLVVFVFWTVAPIIGYSFNESYDISRLFMFPISSRQLLAGSIFAALLDNATLWMIPSLMVVLYIFSTSLFSFLVTGASLLLFLLLVLLLSQFLMLLGAGLLQSRRFKDFSSIFALIVAASYYMLQQTLFLHITNIHWAALLHSRLWQVLNVLPPGAASSAIGAAAQGKPMAALGWLCLLAVYFTSLLFITARILDAVHSGLDGPLQSRLDSKEKEIADTGETREKAGWLQSKIPPVMFLMMQKELRYFQRSPFYRLILANTLYMVVVIVAGSLPAVEAGTMKQNLPHVVAGVDWAVLFLPMLVQTTVVGNFLGLESLTQIFLTPASRRDMILGKNIAYFSIFGGVNCFIVTAVSLFHHAAGQILPMIVWALLAEIVLLGAGNITSIVMPRRIVMRGWRAAGAAGGGCGRILFSLGLQLVTLALLIPVLAALLLPNWFHAAIWYAFSIPGAVVYSVLIYLLSLYFAVPMLQNREPLIVERMHQQNE